MVLSGWMEGLSLLPTWPGGEVGGFPMESPVTVTGSGGGEPKMFQVKHGCFNTFDWKELET